MIETMTPEKFEEQKQSVITNLRIKPKTMLEQCKRYWGQIIRQRYEFDLRKLYTFYYFTYPKNSSTVLSSSGLNSENMVLY